MKLYLYDCETVPTLGCPHAIRWSLNGLELNYLDGQKIAL